MGRGVSEGWGYKSTVAGATLVARAIRNAMRSRIDSRESFAIKTLVFIARQADSHESLEFPIPGDSRECESCESIRANRFATKGATRCFENSLGREREMGGYNFSPGGGPWGTATSMKEWQ